MKRILFTGLLALVLLAACGSAAGGGATTTASRGVANNVEAGGASGVTGAAASTAASMAAAPAAGQPVAGQSKTDANGQQVAAAQNAQAQINRKVIRTATLQLLVDKVDVAEEQLRKLAADSNGFVFSAQASGEDDKRTATITVKVPAERFDAVLNAVGKLAITVESREVKGEDVTDQYVDLQARLKNLQTVESRYVQFLQAARSITESLTVSDRLADVQGQIEQTQGRINLLEQSSALSTITVTLRTKTVVAIVPDQGWSAVTTARSATKNLLAFAQVLADVAIVFGVWIPVWLPLALLALWLLRRSRRVPASVSPSARS